MRQIIPGNEVCHLKWYRKIGDFNHQANLTLMKKILVPSDFSDNAANAIEYATQLALAHQYKVILLHVVSGPTNVNEAEDKLRIITSSLQRSYPTLAITYQMVRGENIPD